MLAIARLHVLVPLALGCVLTPVALFAAVGSDLAQAPETVEISSSAASLEAPQESPTAAPSWTHVGCIQLGTNCFDVFEDKQGNLWVCDECFTTKNPNPGKCRKLTAQEIASALWCA